jgi:hypothetical protein
MERFTFLGLYSDENANLRAVIPSAEYDGSIATWECGIFQ